VSINKQSIKSLLTTAIFISYPIIVHLNVIGSRSVYAAVFSIALILFAVWTTYQAGYRFAAALIALVFFGSVAILFKGTTLQVMFLPPVVINVLLAAYFARTLREGQVPLITKFAYMTDGRYIPEKAKYTRGLTQAWVLFFVLIALESLLLAVLAPPEVWSLFTNFINYLFALIFFVGEYFLRRLILPQIKHLGIKDYFNKVKKIRLHHLD